MFFENKKMELIWQISQIPLKVCHSEGFGPKNSFWFRYFANAPYDVIWEILGGIGYINSKKI